MLLEASGGDGIFGNGNNPNDKFYNLSGKVSFNAATNILTINVGAAGLVLNNDEYRLFLLGSGTQVIRDPQGNALDGENTVNDDLNGAQLPLPSGDGFPGGNFYDTFVINTTAPSIVPNTFALDPSTDTNIPTDAVTFNNHPAFSGTISVAQPAIDPLAGQTVILDISTKGDGVFDRLNVGTAVSDATGHFIVTAGQDAANTGLVTNTAAIPDSPYNVGPDGKLRTKDDSGYTWARVRIVDQSGNTSNLVTDPYTAYLQNHALTGAVIDTSAPVITSFSPTPNTRLLPDASGKITFTFGTNKNIDPASLNASSIVVTRAGADGVLGTADDVNVPIDLTSITATYLGGAAGRLGPETISFTVSGNLPNDIYAVTLKGTGSSPITDVAGNDLDGLFNGTFPSGQDHKPGSDFNPIFVVFSPSNVNVLYVGDPTVYFSDPTAALGSRANPYPTITAALKAAHVGDVVGVLQGVYTEQLTLRPFVKIIGAAPASTDSKFVVGSAQQTVIRAPFLGFGTPAPYATITATNLPTIPGVDTEVAGVTIASPLLFDPAAGSIDPNSIGINITNSNVLLDKDYIVDAHIGVNVVTSGATAITPRIFTDGIIGNDEGIALSEQGAGTIPTPTQVINNTIAFNTIGIMTSALPTSPKVADIDNNIFWENHDQTTARTGTGIQSNVLNKLLVRGNLFSGNGPSDTNPSDDAINVGNGFIPANLKATPDQLGNFTGAPAFVAPRDPRPGSDGPATFFLDANYDITVKSAAIDAAINSLAPSLDFLYRGHVKVTGRGFPGTGPADVGAFEFQGSGGTVVGGAFRVATTSLSPDGSPVSNGNTTFPSSSPPTSITVTFSDTVNKATVTPGVLIMYGDGLNPVGPARAISVTWINDHTARFNLSGGFSSQGSVVVKINAGAIKSVSNAAVAGFADMFRIRPFANQSQPLAPITPAPAPAPVAAAAVVAPSLTPAPAASPKGPTRKGLIGRALKKR